MTRATLLHDALVESDLQDAQDLTSARKRDLPSCPPLLSSVCVLSSLLPCGTKFSNTSFKEINYMLGRLDGQCGATARGGRRILLPDRARLASAVSIRRRHRQAGAVPSTAFSVLLARRAARLQTVSKARADRLPCTGFLVAPSGEPQCPMNPLSKSGSTLLLSVVPLPAICGRLPESSACSWRESVALRRRQALSGRAAKL